MLTAKTIEGFQGSLLRKRFDNPTAVPDFHREMWELLCAKNKYVAIGAPRGHAKSTAVTHTYGLATSLFRESQFTIIVSDTETQAVQFLNDIKMELNDNSDLQVLFGFSKFVKYTENDIIGEMDDGYQFRIMAKGSEQSLRGLKWNGMRPKLILCHEKGTKIYTPETGWIENQEHPNSKVVPVSELIEIEFEDGTTERVTPDHRYYIEGKGWIQAKDLMIGQNVDENISEDILNEMVKKERKAYKNITTRKKRKKKGKRG